MFLNFQFTHSLSTEDTPKEMAKLRRCTEIKVYPYNDIYGGLEEFFKNKPDQEVSVSTFFAKKGLELSRFVERTDFINDEDRDRWVHIHAYCGLISILCADERSVFSTVTYESALRAYKALHINDANYYVGLLHALMEDNKHYLIKTFFGFLSDEKTAQLFDEPDQWLLRMDENGLKITVADSINPDTKAAIIRDYRLTESCGSYILNNKKINSIIQVVDLFPMEFAVRSSPIYAACYSYVRNMYKDYSITGTWANIVDEKVEKPEDYPHVHAAKWLLVMFPNMDKKLFYERCFSMAINSHPSDSIRLLTECIQNGADINHPKYSPIIALTKIYTNSSNHRYINEIGEFLWKNGGDPNLLDFTGIPAFWHASTNRLSGVAGILVRMFMAHPKLNVNIAMHDGLGHVLGWAGSRVPQEVIDHPDININYLNLNNHSVLECAFEGHEYDHVKRVILRGIDVSKKTSNGSTYYHLLFREPPNYVKNTLTVPDIITVLADAGCDVNGLDASNQSPLHAAAHHGEAEWVTVLLQRGANVNGSRECETTPLHLAAERGHVEITKILLEHGADITIRNSAGKLPEEVASFSTVELFDDPKPVLPDFVFKGQCFVITPGDYMPFPRYNANCYIIGDYLYVQGGNCNKYGHDDEYGYVTVQLFCMPVYSFWRVNINGDGPQKWEKIAIPKKVSAEAQNTILVNDKIWFYGASDRFIEFNCKSFEWNSTTVDQHTQHKDNYIRHGFHYGDRIILPESETLSYIDKKANKLIYSRMEQGDFVPNQHAQRDTFTMVGNTIWCKAFNWKQPATIYALTMEKCRWLKACIIPEMSITSAITIFGNRFLLAIGHHSTETEELKHFLVVLDIATNKYSFHKIVFDMNHRVTYEANITEKNSNITITDHFALQMNECNESKTKAESLITENGVFPYSKASLVIGGSVLYIFGGAYESHWPSNEIFTVDLSPLVPYLSLEQQCTVTISSHKNLYTKEQRDGIPGEIKAQNNLGCLY